MDTVNILNKIECAKCLVLDKRIDMFPKIQESFSKFNIDVKPFIAGDGKTLDKYDHIDSPELPPVTKYSIDYPSWWLRPNAYNAWKCHRKMMEQCLAENHNSILILEDDVFIEDDFKDVVSEASQFLSHANWDMIYFGAYHNNSCEQITENVVKLQGSGGWHGVLLKKNVIEILLKVAPVGPFDWICGQWIHQSFDCYGIFPCVISQADGFSYVENGNLEKPSRSKL